MQAKAEEGSGSGGGGGRKAKRKSYSSLATKLMINTRPQHSRTSTRTPPRESRGTPAKANTVGPVQDIRSNSKEAGGTEDIRPKASPEPGSVDSGKILQHVPAGSTPAQNAQVEAGPVSGLAKICNVYPPPQRL